MMTLTAPGTHARWIASPALPAGFVLLWSSGFLVGTVGTRSALPLALTTWRLVAAAVVLTAIAILTRAPWPRTARAWGHLAVTGVLLQAMQFTGVYLGLSLGVPAALSALVMSISPVVVSACAVPLFGERLSGRAWIGSALGLAGVAVAASDRLSGHTSLAGLGLTLLGLAGFAAGTLYQKRFGVTMDLRSGGAVQLAVASLSVIPVAAVHGGLGLPLSASALGSLSWLALANSIGGVSLLFILLRYRRSGAATSLLYFVPPLTAVLAVPLLHQPLHLVTLLGLAVTGIGVILVHRAETHGQDRQRWWKGSTGGSAAGPVAPRPFAVMISMISELLAVWDHQPARAYGGTTDVVAHARDQGRPVRIIWSHGASRD